MSDHGGTPAGGMESSRAAAVGERMVQMGEFATVVVRELSSVEEQRIRRIARTSREPIRRRRATIVLASCRGHAVVDIARSEATSQEYVRRVLHAFNALGVDGLDSRLEQWNVPGHAWR